MTNEEKARELVSGYGRCCKEECRLIALKMAEWKDQQHAKECESLVGLAVKESRQVFIDKACRWLVEHTHDAAALGNITCTSVMTEGTLIEDFRKAMEVKESLTTEYDAEYL